MWNCGTSFKENVVLQVGDFTLSQDEFDFLMQKQMDRKIPRSQQYEHLLNGAYWSMGWKVNWWARMLGGNRAWKLIRDQLTSVTDNKDGGGSYPNLFDAHPPFQIDGNFGCTSGIADMLVQSQDGAMHLLPALPDAWKSKGSVSGLRAIGEFIIEELAWEEGKIVHLTIKSDVGGNLRLRTREPIRNKKLTSVANPINPNGFF